MTERIDLEKEGLSKEQALDLLRQMWEIRMFENRVYDLLGRNIIKGASHLYAGQEAVAVGVCFAAGTFLAPFRLRFVVFLCFFLLTMSQSRNWRSMDALAGLMKERLE